MKMGFKKKKKKKKRKTNTTQIYQGPKNGLTFPNITTYKTTISNDPNGCH